MSVLRRLARRNQLHAVGGTIRYFTDAAEKDGQGYRIFRGDLAVGERES
jgi:hypothetical protein